MCKYYGYILVTTNLTIKHRINGLELMATELRHISAFEAVQSLLRFVTLIQMVPAKRA